MNPTGHVWWVVLFHCNSLCRECWFLYLHMPCSKIFYIVKIIHILYEVSIIYLYHKSIFLVISSCKKENDTVTHSGLVTTCGIIGLGKYHLGYLNQSILSIWPLTRQIWGIWKLRLAYSPETPNLGQNRRCFVPCDLEIWRMTLENNRAYLLCCFKLCATFHSHWWIQTGVTVRKRPFWVKLDDF